MPVTSSQAQVAAIYDEMPLEIAQPVVYAQPAATEAQDLSWLLPSVAVLAVGAAAGVYVGRSRAEALEVEAEEEDFVDLEAAYEEAQILALAGPLLANESKVAMLFSGGRKAPAKAAPKGKAAPKAKPAPRGRPAPKAKPAAKKAAPPPKKGGQSAKDAKFRTLKGYKTDSDGRGIIPAPTLKKAGSTNDFLQSLFSLSLVGGAKGNPLK